ncbi:SDR family oxidoreductase [Actinoplanes friuliensis]|uniref:3-oxoacyl-ACP reductase n=1 Tax=Actinoplanes friuliensis DSM 7358 TaxID=1246995 RepID=U5W829_9ACTN|nr:SDR family oxidoreductase [Actinoplanes friuliensis]AGZ45373.1 3-oxoacyl-ACP reductase [Actinoplanes friuliensis DSM 7358]
MTNIALVTGANKGIGREIAAGLVELGTTVVIGARDEQRGKEAAAELGVESVVLDVTDAGSVRAAAGRLTDRFGRLDVLVNNAGISGGWEQAPSTVDPALVRAVFDVNFFGVLTVTNAMLPLLRRSPAARIVNVSSKGGSLTAQSDPDDPLHRSSPVSAAYVPSKAALNSLTVQYARELSSEGILVNLACPGFVATDLNGFRGTRTTEQGAAIVLRLATLGPDGTTGGFYDDNGRIPW